MFSNGIDDNEDEVLAIVFINLMCYTKKNNKIPLSLMQRWSKVACKYNQSQMNK